MLFVVVHMLFMVVLQRTPKPVKRLLQSSSLVKYIYYIAIGNPEKCIHTTVSHSPQFPSSLFLFFLLHQTEITLLKVATRKEMKGERRKKTTFSILTYVNARGSESTKSVCECFYWFPIYEFIIIIIVEVDINWRFAGE